MITHFVWSESVYMSPFSSKKREWSITEKQDLLFNHIVSAHNLLRQTGPDGPESLGT